MVGVKRGGSQTLPPLDRVLAAYKEGEELSQDLLTCCSGVWETSVCPE